MKLIVELATRNENESISVRALGIDVHDVFIGGLEKLAALAREHNLSELRRFHHFDDLVTRHAGGRVDALELCVSQRDTWFEGSVGDVRIVTPAVPLNMLAPAYEARCETFAATWVEGSEVEELLDACGITPEHDAYGTRVVVQTVAGEYRPQPERSADRA